MSKELAKLLEMARARTQPSQEQEAQRRSFAYGNAKIENDRITKEMIDRQAEILESERRK